MISQVYIPCKMVKKHGSVIIHIIVTECNETLGSYGFAFEYVIVKMSEVVPNKIL